MALPAQHNFKYIGNTALPYAPHFPFAKEPIYVAGSNMMSSNQRQIVRRPGFNAALEGTPTTFAAGSRIKRLYSWRRWGSDFYVMLTEVTATASKVYKLKIGTDASFVLLHTDSSSTEPFDFAVSNNFLYFGNGTDMKKWDGTTLTNWGIVAPTAAPTATPDVTGSGLTATVGYKYVYCYGNSSTSHVSSPSPASARTATFTDDEVDLSGARSTDAQVDKVHIFRTTDGGDGIYFELPGSPIANPGAGGWTFTDTNPDTTLSGTRAPVANQNDPPTASLGFVAYAGRIWGFKNNKLYFSNFEEQGDLGVEEESFASSNFFPFKDEVEALGLAGEFLLVFTRNDCFRISGDSLETFTRDLLFSGMGCLQRAAITGVGKSLAWLDSASKLRITDGITQQEFSLPIRSDIIGIDHTRASLAYHTAPNANWLTLCDGGAGRLRVFDLDTDMWMPPWTAAGEVIANIEAAGGAKRLVIGATSRKVLVHSPTHSAWNDDGTTYTASLTTNLVRVTDVDGPGHLASFEYVVIERNATALSDVLQNTDEWPVGGSYTSINANKINPPLRTQGTTLVEEWFYSRTPACARVSVRMDWAAGENGAGIVGFGFAGIEMQKAAR